ncbi:MAG: orc1/cdc6 family replication initiation protein [Chloroflexi bacterium]|nr:orc1/cdc6 family replication initiation protein [Chloroflexota bacterium]
MANLNPFLYGKPVPPAQHIGRRIEIRTLFSRLANGESTAIVGEPHIGKSSLLRYLADEVARSEWLGKISEQQVCIEIDCQILSTTFTTNDFWQTILTVILETANDAIKKQCKIVTENNFGSFTLEALFKLLAKQERRVVLLIDEFDSLLNHPNFNHAEFFGALRSFATRTDGLAVITASRSSVTQMNRKSAELNPYGSPFFNNSIEVRLLPFAREDAQNLIETTLARNNGKIRFSSEDYDWLFSLAGKQPFLVQVAGASLYDAIANGDAGDKRYINATAIFHQRAAAHFADFWRSLTDDEKRALFLLALAEYRGYVDGRSFDMQQLGKLDRFAPELRHLRELGVVESDTAPNAVAWNDENWRVASAGVVTWLMENIVVGLRSTKDFDAVRGMEFLGPLTRDEIAKIKDIASKIPPDVIKTAVGFIKSLIKPS